MYRYYGDFPKAAPRPKPKPGKTRKKFGITWWGNKWVEILSEFEYDQRMSRGRSYARADMVKNFKVKEGSVTATVKGSIGNYKVNITFKKFSNKEWNTIIQNLTKTPIILSRLLNNEMPENIDKITGYSFIPKSFKSSCSCPDYADPCKHIAAVFYTLADEIDYDPMILFELKGMGKEQVLARQGVMDESQKEKCKEKPKKKSSKAKKLITNKRKGKSKKKNVRKKIRVSKSRKRARKKRG